MLCCCKSPSSKTRVKGPHAVERRPDPNDPILKEAKGEYAKLR